MPGQLDTFHALEQFCGTFIASIRREDRNVAATTTVANGQNRGGNGGGQGRGSGGRGRGGGHGGAGRGGRGRGSGKKSVVWVPYNDFIKLLQEEQDAIKAKRAVARKAAAAARAESDGSNGKSDNGGSDQGGGNSSSGAQTSVGSQMNQRGTRAFSSSRRSVALAKLDRSDELSRFELDSHADTCCFGNNCIFFNQSNVTVDVTPFLAGLGKATDVLTGSCAVAYDDFESGAAVILVFHQSIYFGDMMDGALGCPHQMRMNGLIVRECPRHLDPTPDVLSHTIQHPDEKLVIPLSCDGVISYFLYRKPTEEEFRTCARIEMTSDGPVWEPYATIFAERELSVNPEMVSFFRGDSVFGAVTTTTAATCDVNDFVAKLPFTICIGSLATGRRKGTLTPAILADFDSSNSCGALAHPT
jgi:hypothetical protein